MTVVVLFWFSPFPQEPGLSTLFAAAGLKAHSGPAHHLPDGTLVLYSPPDQVLQLRRRGDAVPVDAAALLSSYRGLADLLARCRLITAWRLQGLDPAAVHAWLTGEQPCPATSGSLPQPDPLTALVTLSLLEQQPELLDVYQDLELQAELAVTETDSCYQQRLQHLARHDVLIEHWAAAPALIAGSVEPGQVPAEDLEQQQQALEQSRRHLEQSEQQRDGLREELTLAQRDRDLAVQQFSEVQLELETLLFTHQDQRQQLAETQRQLRRSQAELTEIQDLAATRAAFIQTLQQQLAADGQTERQRQSELEASREDTWLLQQQLEEVQGELEELLFCNQQLRQQRDGLAQQQQILRRECDELTAQAQRDGGELELTRSRLQEASAELERYVGLTREQARLLNRQNQLTGKALRLAAETPPPG